MTTLLCIDGSSSYLTTGVRYRVEDIGRTSIVVENDKGMLERFPVTRFDLTDLATQEIASTTEEPTSALQKQEGGDHYKHLKIQPMQYSIANELDACQHTAIKYITRFRDKAGKLDLEKAIHCINMLIEFEYGDDVKT